MITNKHNVNFIEYDMRVLIHQIFSTASDAKVPEGGDDTIIWYSVLDKGEIKNNFIATQIGF